MEQLAPILNTKLNRPPTPADLVPRVRLLEQLDHALTVPLTVVVAPAGTGKSTLLSHWLDSCPIPAVWLSLDEDDDNSESFLRLLVAGIQTLFPTFGRSTLAWLSGAMLPSPRALATRLNADLIELGEEIVVLLDDYQFIHNVATHQSLSDLLAHMPSQVHFVVASRTMPEFPLARLRAQGKMIEINASTLRFTMPEAQALLDQVAARSVEPDVVNSLTAELEGWPVGLRLIGMSLRDQSNLTVHLNLRHSNVTRLVYDFFLEEVYAQQPPMLRDALLKSSILDHLAPTLCEAVVASASEEWSGQAFLDWLQRTNLFIVTLDSERGWYRYHHLFQAALRYKLQQIVKPPDIAMLHQRAAGWFADQGMVEQALKHYREAGHLELAVELIARNCRAVVQREQWLLLENWLDLLPVDVVELNPVLLMLRAWTLFVRQGSGFLDPLFQKVEAFLESLQTTSGVMPIGALKCLMVNVWAGPNYVAGNAELVLDRVRKVRRELPGDFSSEENWSICFEACALQLLGQLEGALSLLQSRLAVGIQRTDLNTTRRMLFGLTYIYLQSGQLDELEKAALRFVELNRIGQWPLAQSWVQCGLGMLYYEWNQLDQARRHLDSLIAARHEAHHIPLRDGIFVMALIDDLSGRSESADAALENLRQLAEATSNLSTLRLLASYRAQRAARRGDSAEADRWLHQAQPTEETGPMLRFEVIQLTQARVLLARGGEIDVQQALAHLAHLQQLATNFSNIRRLIEILALTAVAHDRLGNHAAATGALQEALRLAEPGRFTRTFLDLGPGMARMLTALARQGSSSDYIGYLLQQFATSPSLQVATDPVAVRHQQAQAQLIEPLTERESEVLALLIQRQSYQEIALRLIISHATVKAHINHIYQKLNVNSRNEAAATVQRLGILLPEVVRG